MNDNSTLATIPSVEICTDGGCEPSPGPGGYGVVLVHPGKRAEASGGFRKTTNNRMEIFAAIAGLEMLKRPCEVTLYSDSQYVVKAMMEGWVTAWKRRNWWRTKTERPENVDLWQRPTATNIPNCIFKAATENSANLGAAATTRPRREADACVPLRK